jgi:REP element-mobilizing transposase RayT
VPSSDTRRKRIRVDQEVYAQPGTVALLTACTASKAPVFRETENAEIVLSEICGLHGDRWSVLGYCIMPDHVHLLVLNVDGSLIDFMRILKGRTARRLRGQIDGVLWQRSFHDHLIRRNDDISATLRYLFENPVRSGLASNWTDYRWCGSLRWPEIGPDFFAVHPSDMMWAEMFVIARE